MTTLQEIEKILNLRLKADRCMPSSLPYSALWNWLHDIEHNHICIWLHETRNPAHKICLICGDADVDAFEHTCVTHLQVQDGFLHLDINWKTITIVDIPDYTALRHTR